jgi:hypothetical protein
MAAAAAVEVMEEAIRSLSSIVSLHEFERRRR